MYRQNWTDETSVELGKGWARYWLVSSERCGARHGAIAELSVEPGAELPGFGSSEVAMLCLEGQVHWYLRGSDTRVQGPRVAAFARAAGARAWLGRNEGATAARLFVMYGGEASENAIASREAIADDGRPGAQAASPYEGLSLIRLDQVQEDLSLAAGAGWRGLRVRWVVCAETVGARFLTMNWTVFGPGGGHELHRHGSAEEAVFVLEGSAQQLEVNRSTPIGPEDCTFVPTGEWHGHKADPDRGASVLGCYLGAGSVADAGYEAYQAS